MNTNKTSLEMLSKALEMEHKGIEFYQSIITISKNNLAKKMIEMLRNEEVVHIERIKNIYTGLEEKKVWTDEWETYKTDSDEIKNFFKTIKQEHNKTLKGDVSDINALEVGADFEEKSINYYSEHLEKASDPIEKRFLNAMIREEKFHLKVLRDMNFYLTNPEGYFREIEKGGLDGA